MMAVGLHGDHDLLQACQDLFRLGQCQPQLRDIAEITKRSISRRNRSAVPCPARSFDAPFGE